MKSIFSILLFVIISFYPINTVRAFTPEIPFGGLHIYTLGLETCTCGGNSTMIFDYMTMTPITLYWAPWSIFYSYFNVYGSSQLGTYNVPAMMHCMIYVGEECEPLSINIGNYGSLPGTGTTIL